VFKRELSNNEARLHIELGFLLLTLLLSGCCSLTSGMTPQEKIEYYNCYWGCKNDAGDNGWCCDLPVPSCDHSIFNCENAGERIVQ